MLVPMLVLWPVLLAVSPLEETLTRCERDQITVEGQAEVRVPPDLVRIVSVAENRSPSQAQAEAAVKAARDKVLALAREHTVKESDIDSSDYAVQPQYEYANGKRLSKRLGYRVRSTVRLTLRDLSRFGALVSALGGIDGVALESTDPDVEQTRSHRDEARLQAVRAAREKAVAIAGELGQTLGRAMVVDVDGASGDNPSLLGTNFRNYVNVTTLTEGDEDGGPSYALGAITLTARVKVTFELK